MICRRIRKVKGKRERWSSESLEEICTRETNICRSEEDREIPIQNQFTPQRFEIRPKFSETPLFFPIFSLYLYIILSVSFSLPTSALNSPRFQIDTNTSFAIWTGNMHHTTGIYMINEGAREAQWSVINAVGEQRDVSALILNRGSCGCLERLSRIYLSTSSSYSCRCRSAADAFSENATRTRPKQSVTCLHHLHSRAPSL